MRLPDFGERETSNQVFVIAVAVFLSAFLILSSLQTYGELLRERPDALSRLALLALTSLVLVLLGWVGLKKIGAIGFAAIAVSLCILDLVVASAPLFLVFGLNVSAMLGLLFWLDKIRVNEVVVRAVDIEKSVGEKNDLELAFKEKGGSISVYFEKYSTYYNLRRLAEEFSSTLDLTCLGDLIVERTFEFMQKGDNVLLFLARPDKDEISLVASKSAEPARRSKRKLGDLFDSWVLRNRLHLLVSDTQRDFRFDLKKTTALEGIRSAILSPLIYEGKVVGTLRADSAEPDIFGTDDLRLLDAISTVSSSAISNAMLFQRTEELAIRDSLTHLYLPRYFLERLQEEHRRALLTHRPLSLLMCDLDHFKKINDRYGHAVGDYVLTTVAQTLRDTFEHGVIARYGGEEFTVLLPDIPKRDAYQAAEKICGQLAALKIEIRREKIPVTISIGVGNVPHDTLDGEELIRISDERLYQAKRFGRNQVC